MMWLKQALLQCKDGQLNNKLANFSFHFILNISIFQLAKLSKYL